MSIVPWAGKVRPAAVIAAVAPGRNVERSRWSPSHTQPPFDRVGVGRVAEAVRRRHRVGEPAAGGCTNTVTPSLWSLAIAPIGS